MFELRTGQQVSLPEAVGRAGGGRAAGSPQAAGAWSGVCAGAPGGRGQVWGGCPQEGWMRHVKWERAGKQGVRLSSGEQANGGISLEKCSMKRGLQGAITDLD